jgi:FtsP/CotA-like multicopper oxidase with cupredoxin domain
MDMSRIDFAAIKNTTEIWQITASDDVAHNFHVHDVQFQVLALDGAAPPPELRGWKDTIFMPPNRSARLALRISDHADPTAPYMYHCHLLAHEDQGLMGQFVVVEAGQRAGTSANDDTTGASGDRPVVRTSRRWQCEVRS